MDGKTAAIQWPHDGCPYVWGAENQQQLVFSFTLSQGTLYQGLDSLHGSTSGLRDLSETRSQESEAGLHGKLPLRAT